jgi:hypothetical protein
MQVTNTISARHLLPAGFFIGYFFDPEDEGDIYLRNVGCFATDYTGVYPR